MKLIGPAESCLRIQSLPFGALTTARPDLTHALDSSIVSHKQTVAESNPTGGAGVSLQRGL